MMKLFLMTVFLSLLLSTAEPASAQSVKVGLEVLEQQGFDILKGKRVGLITNPTGVDFQLRSSIDLLHAAQGVNLVALFGPEHGARGNEAAGEQVDTYTDSLTNLPVFSLYGKRLKPTPEMLASVDVLVYDIQDIGCRSYTFISTMGLAMEAAAECGKEFVVLDRPNPVGGLKVEGCLVEPGMESFVGRFPIPYLYGLTCGELANYLNEEGLLKNKAKCKLTIVKMDGWKRSMLFAETGRPWVPTSPHIPRAETALNYPSTGIMGELGVLSEGVGYPLPFEILATDWGKAVDYKKWFDSLKLPGFAFRPIYFKPYYGTGKGKKMQGLQVYITQAEAANLSLLQFYFMEANHALYPSKDPFALADKSRWDMFDKVCGTKKVRELFQKRFRTADIYALWTKDAEDFKTKSKKYYLYP